MIAGVKIGHGAVVGAKIVPTKNVATYAFVASSPLREIRNTLMWLLKKMLHFQQGDRLAEKTERMSCSYAAQIPH